MTKKTRHLSEDEAIIFNEVEKSLSTDMKKIKNSQSFLSNCLVFFAFVVIASCITSILWLKKINIRIYALENNKNDSQKEVLAKLNELSGKIATANQDKKDPTILNSQQAIDPVKNSWDEIFDDIGMIRAIHTVSGSDPLGQTHMPSEMKFVVEIGNIPEEYKEVLPLPRSGQQLRFWRNEYGNSGPLIRFYAYYGDSKEIMNLKNFMNSRNYVGVVLKNSKIAERFMVLKLFSK